MVGRIVGLADQIEALASETTPLLARRNFATWLGRLSGRDADPTLIDALRDLGRSDGFWLGLYSEELAGDLSRQCVRLKEQRSVKGEAFIEAFADVIDARLGYTTGVSQKVARLAEQLGRSIGFDEAHLRLLRAAAYLHDVGQLSVSERIMAKPGILSVDELEVLRLHPVYSRDVVAGIGGLEEVAEWVAAHHERVDGRGYPDGNAGDEIPLEARILDIVDTYVAITSDRPHRARAGIDEARRMLRSAAGTQLDPDLVEIFLREVADADQPRAQSPRDVGVSWRRVWRRPDRCRTLPSKSGLARPSPFFEPWGIFSSVGLATLRARIRCGNAANSLRAGFFVTRASIESRALCLFPQ